MEHIISIGKIFLVFIVRHPEAELVRKSFTLRKMDLPPQVLLTKRSLLRWIALSLGLISENESRYTFIEILDAFLFFSFSKKEHPSSDQIKLFLEKNRHITVSGKLVRYHLNRLCELGLLIHRKGHYSINPAPDSERNDLAAAFLYWYRRDFEEAIQGIGKGLSRLQEAYERQQQA